MNKEFIQNLIKETSPCTIVAATKYIDSNKMRELFSYGINNFGENRVDSFLNKYDELEDLNIKWHFIGHLQRNKADLVVNKIDVLHSLDSLKLAEILNSKRKNTLDVYIEIKIVQNDEKSGVNLDELDDFINCMQKYEKLNVVGFMVMTNKDQNDQQKASVFKKTKQLLDHYRYKKLSMGMSDDYQIAIKEGATEIRLGRMLFEEEDFIK